MCRVPASTSRIGRVLLNAELVRRMEIAIRMSVQWLISRGRVSSCICVLTVALATYACSSPTGFGGPLDSTWSQWPTPEDAGFNRTALEMLPEYLSTLNTTGLMVVVDGKVLLFPSANAAVENVAKAATRSVVFIKKTLKKLVRKTPTRKSYAMGNNEQSNFWIRQHTTTPHP